MSSLLINAPPPVYRPSCLCRATLWTIARPTTRQPASLLVSARTTARVVALEELVKHVQPCTIGESRHRRRESASADDARARAQTTRERESRRRRRESIDDARAGGYHWSSRCWTPVVTATTLSCVTPLTPPFVFIGLWRRWPRAATVGW